MLGHSPRSVSAAEGTRAAVARLVVVYWRKGCPYSRRLRLVLGRRGRKAVWVDIWADPAGAAFCRSVNNGDETVPTVLINGRPHTNPSPRLVRAALG